MTKEVGRARDSVDKVSCKHEALSLNPQNLHIKMVGQSQQLDAYNLSMDKVETGGSWGLISERVGHKPASETKAENGLRTTL